MATMAQVAANRANATHSTGPRSAEGKARCARNALTHGLRSQEAVIETERREEFDSFAEAMRAELCAGSQWEAVLVERVIVQAWRLRRAARLEAAVLDHAMEPAKDRDANWRKGIWDWARQKAKERGEDASAVPEPRPRSWPGERDPYFLGEALVETLGTGSPLDVLRRYERTGERAMYEAMRQLRAARKLRAEGGQEAWAAEGAAEGAQAHQETCQTDPISQPAPPDQAGEENCQTDPICQPAAEGGPAAEAELAAAAQAQTSPTPAGDAAETPAEEGICQTDPISQPAPPDQAGEENCQTDPIRQPAAETGAAAAAAEEVCQTDPIAQRELRIAAIRARRRAMLEEERRMCVTVPEGAPMQVRT